MIAEIDTVYKSWEPNRTVFTGSYDNGDPQSVFALKIAADPLYFPYSVTTKSTTSVLSSDEMPAKSFAFMDSKTMARLVDFHDRSSLLDSSIADMREDVFRGLDAARKLSALGKIVHLYREADDAYGPCRAALLSQDKRLTTRSPTWTILFPIKSGSYPVWIGVIAVCLTVLWQSFFR